MSGGGDAGGRQTRRFVKKHSPEFRLEALARESGPRSDGETLLLSSSDRARKPFRSLPSSTGDHGNADCWLHTSKTHD